MQLQWINNLNEAQQSMRRSREDYCVIIFLKVVYPLKCPGTACLSYLDDGLIRCLPSKTSVRNCLSKIKTPE